MNKLLKEGQENGKSNGRPEVIPFNIGAAAEFYVLAIHNPQADYECSYLVFCRCPAGSGSVEEIGGRVHSKK